MVNINKYIKALLHPAGGHQGSHKAHEAGNQKNILNGNWQIISTYTTLGMWLFIHAGIMVNPL